MKSVKILKITVVALMALICVFSFVGSVYADDPWYKTAEDTIDDAAGKAWTDNDSKNLVNSTSKIMGVIITVLRIVASGIAIIMLTVVAIKYMMASPGDRADIKKHAIPFVVGAVILFASSGILTIIQSFANNIG